MMRSRTPWVAGLAAVSMLALSACSSNGDTPADASSLTVWVMGDSSANFDTLVAPFTKDTGIAVKTVAVPWDSIDQRFTTAVASGNGPDVLQIGISKLRTFADSGALLPLDETTIADYPNLAADGFIDGVAGDATAIGGEVVSVPWVSDTRVLFYRTDILEENGITAPPTTWDELRADAKVLSDRGVDQYGYYVPQWDSSLPVIMTWGNGGDILTTDQTINFDTPEFEAAVDIYAGLYADGSVPTNADFDQTQGFTSGITPMVISGPYLANAISAAAPELEGKWSVAPVPASVDHTSLLAGSNLSVWGKSGNTEGALKLLDFLSTPETQLAWYAADGQLPTSKAALADPTLLSDPITAVYAAQLADSRLLPLVPSWDGETGKALLDALNSIVLTGADRASTLDTLFQATGDTSVS
ncbi:carbohydrate ABC transporter substrate-binding protein, CUT1 family [Sanguibacter gelidistatuariae]|uniref:Carbohydrate ABC transporter substrate-binding protein, CUT1 family n=1 Tax=Sanguibacter gelidistatuariae TaxID=1814289 RepID=A0A1G6Q9W8_9MICO|nr:extracellular solute-binding protein [Sanguibacter gelidistatuariae]SDC88694.1 carbohydrate ABC transporter substrate-binding protein, CUT1 family [Sanguibacter gelidistatuariae]